MPLKDRLRRAITRSPTHSSSNSSVSTDIIHTITNKHPQTPDSSPASSNTPPVTSAKIDTSSRLSKTLTWTSRKNKREEKIERWEKYDQQEWKEPGELSAKGQKNRQYQDLLRSFGWKTSSASMEGRRSNSSWSGVSPGNSRMNSVTGEQHGKRASSVVAPPFSRELDRGLENVAGDRYVSKSVEEK
jgi:hypothetical protein